jgi:hypothetical protein
MAEIRPVPEQTRFNATEIGWMVALLVLGELVGIGGAVLTHRCHPKLAELFATAAITLFFGSLLGGVVTLLISDFDRRRVQRALQRDFVANVLADLKAVYDRVDRGRTLIRARRSAKTYGEEMQEFIEARVQLQNVVRALDTDTRGASIREVRVKVGAMKDYLRALLDEYEAEYKEISLAQSIFEARLKTALQGPLQGDDPERMLPGNLPWEKLEKLPKLRGFLLPTEESTAPGTATVSNYRGSFLQPLDDASELLRAALLKGAPRR